MSKISPHRVLSTRSSVLSARDWYFSLGLGANFTSSGALNPGNHWCVITPPPRATSFLCDNVDHFVSNLAPRLILVALALDVRVMTAQGIVLDSASIIILLTNYARSREDFSAFDGPLLGFISLYKVLFEVQIHWVCFVADWLSIVCRCLLQ